MFPRLPAVPSGIFPGKRLCPQQVSFPNPMQSPSFTTCLKLLVITASITLTTALPAAERVVSPDGKVRVSIELKDGKPYWDVELGSNKIIAGGLLGLETETDNFSGSYQSLGIERVSGDTTWERVWGDTRAVRDHYNQITVKLRETLGERRMWNAIVRVSNEGVGLRYEIPKQPNLVEVTLKKRLTEYKFGADHPIYQNRNYEYGTVKISGMSRSEGNVTVGVGGGSFVSLTDADRTDFPMTFWDNAEGMATILGRFSPAVGVLPFATSWEVMIVGGTLAELYENRCIVENLNPPCAVKDTSWIKPGKAISQIRNGGLITADLMKVLDFASANNIQYLEIDHSWNGAETKWTAGEIATFDEKKEAFWESRPEWRENVKGNPIKVAKGYVPFRPHSFKGGNRVDLDIEGLCAYGKSLNPPVGVCVYVRGALLKEFGGEYPIAEVFRAYAKMGLAGVKPGFVPQSTQQNEKAIVEMVRIAAEHRLIVVIHDAYHPSGTSRTYPNLVNIEGGAGDEAEHSIPPEMKSLHDVMLVFTRLLMGPFDYTPEIGREGKTYCHQVSMVSLYQGRPTIRGGMKQWSPGGEGGAEIEFIKKWPGIFDETKVTAELGKSVIMAKRNGSSWFVAGMSGPDAQSVTYPLDFLTPGKSYTASVFSDVAGSRKSERSEKQVTSKTVLPIAMNANGGHLMIVEETR